MTKMKLSISGAMCTAMLGSALFSGIAFAEDQTLEIKLMVSSGPQRTQFVKKINEFQKKHPEIKVKNIEYEQEKYKSQMEGWLTAKQPSGDILFWFAGEKLGGFVEKGLIEDISGTWSENKWDDSFTQSSKGAVTFSGKVYGLPMSYYQWGFYYKKSTFAKFSIKAPETWDEFLAASETLKKNNVTPIALGALNTWPALGWFDYLNLRINGLKFHKDVMTGKVPFTDSKIKEVFTTWKMLLDKGYFSPKLSTVDWQIPLPYMYRGEQAMMLMGNFIIPQIQASQLDDFGFFRFPRIKKDVPWFEDSPMDVLVVPANATNKKAAKTFLAFMAEPGVQSDLNNSMSMISPNKNAKPSSDRFIQAGAGILKEAEGIAQFFDRDAPAALADAGTKAIKSFLEHPDQMDKVLADLEIARKSLPKK